MKAMLLMVLGLLALSASAATLREVAPKAFLVESFDAGWDTQWVHSSHDKYTGTFTVTESADPELQITDKEKHYGLTALLSHPVDPSEGLVVQYDAAYTNIYHCGGSYVKLLTHSEGFEPHELVDTTPYSIMFGPDKCGDPHGKIHLILRHRNPVNGVVTEHHLKEPPAPITIDNLPHVYTLIIKPDSSFEVLIDGEVKSSGSLLEMLEPPINPSKEIPDPEDTKPEDWVDTAKIPDPTATQPDDWDMRPEIPDIAAVKPKGWLDNEPKTIPDPAAKMPDDWDEEEDGEWEAPSIPNPKCKKAGCGEWTRPTMRNPDFKGPWQAPLIDNPEYKGPWVQKTIPNNAYFEDKTPLKNIGKIGAIAFEIWTVDVGYMFDSIYVGNDPSEAANIRKQIWKPKITAKKEAAARAAKEKADEAERQKKEELEAKKRKQEKDSFTQKTADAVLEFLESDRLASIKPMAEPVMQAIQRTPASVYGLLAAPVVLILTLALAIPGMRMTKKSKKDRYAEILEAATKAKQEAAAKKTDVASEQETDKDEETKDEAEGRTQEITADEDEDEGSTVRRRPHRA